MEANRYFDNAATSFPKPPEVGEAMLRYLRDVGAPYGRSAYPRAFEVARVVETARDRLAACLGIGAPENLVFTPNATVALNMVLFHFLVSGDKVLISALEHNAVMRPLEALKEKLEIRVEPLPSFPDGRVDPTRMTPAFLAGVKLVIVNHQSNVNGVIQPLPEIKKAIGGTPLLVDASQSAGAIPIKTDEWGIDFLAVTGHKSLLGPTGTGALYIRRPSSLQPLIYGGTGSASDRFTLPSVMPDKFEAGTGNIVGIYGLDAALNHRPSPQHTPEEFARFLAQIKNLPGLKVYAAADTQHQGELFSISHPRFDPAVIGNTLWEKYGIEVRLGMHCAPLAHQTLGTFPTGTVRIAPSPYHRPQDFDYVVGALQETLTS